MWPTIYLVDDDAGRIQLLREGFADLKTLKQYYENELVLPDGHHPLPPLSSAARWYLDAQGWQHGLEIVVLQITDYASFEAAFQTLRDPRRPSILPDLGFGLQTRLLL
jgi:hypothetical protein